MRIYLVRHARGVSRAQWQRDGDGEEHLRPLNERGVLQAVGLADALAPAAPERILSGPAARCRQTVEPLAERLGLPIELDSRLDEGARVDDAVALLQSLGECPSVLCTHAALIRGLLPTLEVPDLETTPFGSERKGSFWALRGSGFGPLVARYVEPRSDEARLRPLPPPPRRAAVLDLGSTSFHLLVAERADDGTLREIAREKAMLRLGASVAGGRGLTRDAVRRAVAAARELGEVAEREKAECLLPVATAALREAANGQRVAREISRALGHPVRVLSGEEEARLMFAAVRRRLELGGEPLVGIDLGGGSLEVAAGHGSWVDAEVTLPLGAVRLREELVGHDPMRPAEAAALRARVCDALAPHRARLLASPHATAVAVGGTARALARLLEARGFPECHGGVRAPLDALEALAAELETSTQAERLEMPGMRRRRADLLPTASLVLCAAARELGLESLLLCDWGLREGVLLETFAVH